MTLNLELLSWIEMERTFALTNVLRSYVVYLSQNTKFFSYVKSDVLLASFTCCGTDAFVWTKKIDAGHLTFFQAIHHLFNEEHFCGNLMYAFERFFSSGIQEFIFIMDHVKLHKNTGSRPCCKTKAVD
ncbi:hypothetical protein RF11_03229 [Thelohanellus kitauei]|uniref:Uncharacterized protein n=1 Tax=Thelohanellus kitauei TaxID=669202 RepID=A0A0C2IFU5_THEKT|nr:hypothetical protein RF11_03229 [Thelohanellus kitauei]